MPSSFEHIANERRSTRAYLKTPVERHKLEQICNSARKAPSGANLQPGTFHVLTGDALGDLSKCLEDALHDGRPTENAYSYFPSPMPPELKDRQRKAGFALYDALGIDKRDIPARKDQFAKNYRFFDAPIGVVVTIDRKMGKGCFMDLGMAIVSFMYAAQDLGLSTTGIGALANYASLVAEALELPNEELVVCGIAVGYADPEAAVNQFETERLTLEEFTSFRGF